MLLNFTNMISTSALLSFNWHQNTSFSTVEKHNLGVRLINDIANWFASLSGGFPDTDCPECSLTRKNRPQ
jgi:hypothetical protein